MFFGGDPGGVAEGGIGGAGGCSGSGGVGTEGGGGGGGSVVGGGVGSGVAGGVFCCSGNGGLFDAEAAFERQARTTREKTARGANIFPALPGGRIGRKFCSSE